MIWKQLFARKSLETLHAEMESDNRLRRVLGPVALTSLGVGAIIGAGIFVMTGRVAAEDAGPSILLSFAVAGFACALAALCYAEFASMAPVAGSAYTYAYATLGELLAWIIGWDLILEYALSAAAVASAWSEYFNEFLEVSLGEGWTVPWWLSSDPFSQPGAWFNLPALAILFVVTTVLVIGIRESALFNMVMVIIKLSVVLFVIAVGVWYVNTNYYTEIPQSERRRPEELQLPAQAQALVEAEAGMLKTAHNWVQRYQAKDGVENITIKSTTGTTLTVKPIGDKEAQKARAEHLARQATAVFRMQLARDSGNDAFLERTRQQYEKDLPITEEDKLIVQGLLAEVNKTAKEQDTAKWGMMAALGIDRSLAQVDEKVRSNFFPYGLSGMMLGAALVFFAFIGFDSISTHSEEAVRPQRDVPIGIIASLVLCTLLYIAVAAVIIGMVPYPQIDTEAAVAAAFTDRASQAGSPVLRGASALIALGALAGMTSVLLITFLSQARIFLAMARDKLVSPRIFGAIHTRFRTPHVSTILTGVIMSLVAALTPIGVLAEMVNIGTLFAFTVVCAAVLILRIRRPEVPRPFRCPALFIVAPLGIVVNVLLMLFLPLDTWLRLLGWLILGLAIYFGYSFSRSQLGQELRNEGQAGAAPPA
jgi:amino acid transporter